MSDATPYLGPDRGDDGCCNRCGEKCRKDVCNCPDWCKRVGMLER